MQWKQLSVGSSVHYNALRSSSGLYFAKALINNETVIGKYRNNSFFRAVKLDYINAQMSVIRVDVHNEGDVDILIINDLYIKKWLTVTVDSTNAATLQIPGIYIL